MTTTQCTLCNRLRVYTQSQTTTASLLIITLTGHVAFTLVDFFGGSKLITAEALAAVLGAGEGVTSGVAISDALCVRNGVLTDVGEFDA